MSNATSKTHNIKISTTQARYIKRLIDELPELAAEHLEIKEGMIDAMEFQQEKALVELRRRIHPEILVCNSVVGLGRFYRAILALLGEYRVVAPDGPLESDTTKCISAMYPGDVYKPWLEKANANLQSIQQGRINGDSLRGNPQPSEQQASPRRQSTFSNESYTQSLDSKKNAYATAAFKDSSMRYDGALDSQPSLHRFKQVYSSIMQEHTVSAEHQHVLLHHALEGVARDYFFEKIRGRATNLDSAFKMLDKHFDSENRRAQARAYLEMQSLSGIRSEFQCSTTKALEYAVQRVNNVTPQCGPTMNDDDHKNHFLAGMLRQEEWAQPVLATRLTQALGYGKFQAMLESALTQKAISNPEETIGNDEMAYGTNFGSTYGIPRGRGGRNRRGNGRRGLLGNNAWMNDRRFRNRKLRTAEELRALKNRTECLRCRQKGHWRAECNMPGSSITDAVKARIKGLGDNHQATRNVFLAMITEEDLYYQYLDVCESGTEPHTEMEGESTNMFGESMADTMFNAEDPLAAMCNAMSIEDTIDATQQLDDCAQYFNIGYVYDVPQSIHSLQRVTN